MNANDRSRAAQAAKRKGWTNLFILVALGLAAVVGVLMIVAGLKTIYSWPEATPVVPTIAPAVDTSRLQAAQNALPTEPVLTLEAVESEAAPAVAEVPIVAEVVVRPITRDSGYVEVTRVSRTGTFEPAWPEGTIQTSVGYSNPEEFPDGRTFWTRSPTNPDEVLAFVARCVSVNGGRKVCQGESAGALVGLILGSSEGEFPVTLWDAELKTLTIPGGLVSWEKYITILGEFISANKGGKPVIVLGPAN